MEEKQSFSEGNFDVCDFDLIRMKVRDHRFHYSFICIKKYREYELRSKVVHLCVA